MSENEKSSWKWLAAIVASILIIFLAAKYGGSIPPEVWEAVAEAAETIGEGIGDD